VALGSSCGYPSVDFSIWPLTPPLKHRLSAQRPVRELRPIARILPQKLNADSSTRLSRAALFGPGRSRASLSGSWTQRMSSRCRNQ